MMAGNVNHLQTELLYTLRDAPVVETRHGKAKAYDGPILFGMRRPWENVLFCPARMANPYFHVMETVWMLAGSKNGKWLEPFNKNIMSYAEDDGYINGAYGHRWRNAFMRDQLIGVIKELTRDKHSRQAVIAMYNPFSDWQDHWRDRPCNTHIYFRRRETNEGPRLDMTVCNRSNDLVWGACGANAVHMTYMHQFICSALKISQGRYHVMSNNLHIYEHHWHMLDNPLTFDWYGEYDVFTVPIFQHEQSPWEFLMECEDFVRYADEIEYKSQWLQEVVKPMYSHYMCRLNGDKVTYDVEDNADQAWGHAEYLWREWHD